MSTGDRRQSQTDGFARNLGRRHRIGKFWQAVFMASTVIGIVALTALLFKHPEQCVWLRGSAEQ